MIWLILVAVIGILVWYNFIKPMSHFTEIGVKQSKPWPFFGDQWQTIFGQTSFCEFIESMYNMYPNNRYSGFYQLSVPTLLIRDPELIKQITVKDFEYFTDHRSFVDPDVDPLWGGNLFALKGRKWREVRATLSGSFTSSKMKNMFNLINEAAQNFVKFFKDRHEDLIEIELKDAFTKYTNDVIATAAFGIKVDSLAQPNNIFYLMGKKVTNLSALGSRLKFSGYIVMPKLLKFLKIQLFSKEAENFFNNIINETIQVREEQGIVRQDMIHLLLETRKGIKDDVNEANETGFATAKESTNINKYKQGKHFSNADITSQALVFFFAGFDAISTALCFGSYELALNEDVQTKLRLEIIETDKTINGKLTYDTLLKMKYMDMVVSEILRKWPIAGIDRKCTKPYIIEPATTDENPVQINVGDLIWLPIFGLHRDPQYFPNPEKFDPERFSVENKDNIKPYTYIPFGAGPRNCIGSRFTLLEIKALLYHLLLNFEILATKRTPIPLKLDKGVLMNSAQGGFWLGLRCINN